jgi:serine O-acetyltransferase
MLKQTILSDYRRCGLTYLSLTVLIKTFIIMPNPGLKFMTIFRLTQYYRKRNRFLFYFFFLWLRNLKVKYGFDISYRTQIGKGFYIGHFGGVVIHGDTIIGDNCNISQGITFGVNNYGATKGVPTIGNNVFVGPGACVFGNITIGNHVTIGANTVVTESVRSHVTVMISKVVIIEKDLSPFYIHNRV